MMEKRFKNLEEQIEILKSKGLIIEEEESVKEILLRENYFFINGYRYPLMKSNKEKKFLEGATFDELYSLFLFDRNIRNVFFKNILVIENNLKSIFSYQLSKQYGYKEKDYLKPSNFTPNRNKTRQVNDLIRKMKRQIRVNGKSHSATSHYMMNYGYVPLWILVKVLSFGIVGELFAILKYEDQKKICDVYHLDVDTMITYLPILSNYRNLCAHEDILYENKTQKVIPDTIYHKLLEIEKGTDGYLYGKKDLFALVLIMKDMLTTEEFKNMMLEFEHYLHNLEYNLHTIGIGKILKRMGFPDNWKQIIGIERSFINEE